jgi:hypothetical protein
MIRYKYKNKGEHPNLINISYKEYYRLYKRILGIFWWPMDQYFWSEESAQQITNQLNQKEKL